MGAVRAVDAQDILLDTTQPSLAAPFVSSPIDLGFDLYINGNGLLHVADDFALGKENGDLADEVLEDFEEYCDDINDRLIVSRMVSDSVVKGIVTAVEQDAADKIASKDLQLANLEEYLHSRPRDEEVSAGRVEEGVYFPVVKEAVFEVGNCGSFSCFSNACMDHENMRDRVHALRTLSREQFERAKKEVAFARTSNPIKRIGSASELVGLVGILHEKQSESWMHVDKMLDRLKITVDDVCAQVDDLLLSSKISLCELQKEQDLTRKLEGMVMGSVLRKIQEEFEDNLWDQNARHFATQNMGWHEKFNSVAGLGTQLDAILKSLSLHENGLVSHGSLDLDHPHFGENGTLDASNIHVAETYDFQQLKHMSNMELVDYFNNIITKMKRDHESALQQKTEEYFRLKRESLNERSSFFTHRKEEEFDVLRKKIPQVILKLEDFILENERFPLLARNVDHIEKLKHRLDSLQSENCHLRECLADKINEVKCLEDMVSSVLAAKSFENSLSEERMLKSMENFTSERADSCIETLLNEEVYKCALREQIAQTRCDCEDSQMELIITQEIYDSIIKEAAFPAETANTFDFEDSDIESLIVQGLSGIILLEAVKDAEQEFDKLYKEDQINKCIINCLETRSLEKENELSLEVEENRKLKQEILHLERQIKEKEKLAMEFSISLSKEREQFKQASIELCSSRAHASQQEILATERNRELELLRVQHLEALGHIEVGKIETQKLNQMLDQTKQMLLEANKERNTALSLAQEMNDKLLSNEATEEKIKVEMKKVVDELSKMFDDFQCRVSDAIGMSILRMTAVLRKTGLMYKRKLERRSADLQMAEAEVDLLGDEVDTLLSLLEKTYIALDHYSPILKHYPGINEILELVRKELTSESTKMP